MGKRKDHPDPVRTNRVEYRNGNGNGPDGSGRVRKESDEKCMDVTLVSEKEPEWVEEWRGTETRLAIWPGDWEWRDVQKELKRVDKWWKDICPDPSKGYAMPKGKGKSKEKEGDEDDLEWAPLDRTSGWDGLWMFLVALIFLMLSPSLRDAPIHEGLAWLTSWQLLVEDIVKVMVKVVNKEVRPIRWEKESEMPQASGGAKRKVVEHADDEDDKNDSPPSKRIHARGKEDEDGEDSEDNSPPSKKIRASKKGKKDDSDDSPPRIPASKKGKWKATTKASTPQTTRLRSKQEKPKQEKPNTRSRR
ncbi:hypothetical protein K435DRAFT_864899 [Dendrothele bispora CBS 962.96]|uniref:Uncharacterized protein n=1 Tax=Dendrothele bispora (strain CBS 962.96) TaxID=1314807 RepID=A0A4S8LKP7_DENBC|nr:hypothetical protein K435DRAFT_864899 [Dendrothele bispora CBS 962.96]